MHRVNAIIGTVTAATKQSGREVGNFVKFVLPRLTSAPAQKALEMLKIDMTDSNGHMKDAMQIYKEVAEQFVHLDQLNQNIVAEGLAGKHHISRMTALLNNMALYDKMLQDSINSNGSAVVENEVYMESLQARINLMKQSWESLALSVGESFLTEGLIQSIRMLDDFARNAKDISGSIGALPVILGAIGSVLVLVSGRFRTASREGTILSATLTGLKVTANGATGAMRTLLATTGVGLAFTLVGVAIEKLLGHMGKLREEQEKLQRKNEEMTREYSDSKDSIDELVTKYEEYDTLIKNGDYKLEDLQEYHRIQSELAGLMPSLVIGEDSYGNKILVSSEATKAKIELLEKQIAQQEKLNALQKEEEVRDNHKLASDALRKAEKAIEQQFLGVGAGNPIKTIEDAEKKLEEFQRKIESGGKLNTKEIGIRNFAQAKLDEFQTLSNQVDSAKILFQNATMEMINTTIALDENTSRAIGSIVNDFSLFVATSEESGEKVNNVFSSLLSGLQSDNGFKNVIADYSIALDEFKKKSDEGYPTEQLEEYKNKVTDTFGEVKKSLIDYAKSSGFSEQAVNKLSSQMDSSVNSALGLNEAISKIAQTTGKTREEIEAEMFALGENTDEYDENTDAKYRNIDATEALFGATSEQINQIQNAIESVMLLSQMEHLNEQQKGHLSNAIAFLTQMFPHLDGKIQENIGWLYKEAQMMSTINGVSSDLAKAMTHDQNSQTRIIAEQVNQRIEAYNKENKALQTMIKNRQMAYEAIKNDDAMGLEVNPETMRIFSSANAQIPVLEASLATYSASILDSISRFQDVYKASTGTGSGGSKGSSSSGSSTSQKDRQIDKYLTDQYAQAMENLSLKIQQSEYRMSRLSTTSAEYRKELTTQINLHKEQQRLTTNEINRLTTRNNTLRNSLSAMGEFSRLTTEQKERYNELAKEIDDNIKQVNSLNKSHIDLQTTIESMSWDKVQSQLRSYSEALEKIDYQLNRSRSIQSLYEEGTKEWSEELTKQNKLLQEKALQTLKDREATQKLLREETLSADKKKELRDEVDKLSLAYWDLQGQIKSNTDTLSNYRNSVADNLINTMKRAYEKQKEFALKAIDEEMKALDKAHNDKMRMYDEDISRFEEVVNRKLREIDDQSDQESFDKELNKLIEERQDIQRRINILSLDDSAEAQAKKFELEKQLAEQTEKINDLQNNRTKDLRKKSLQDQLNDYKKDMDNKKKAETDKYNAEKERLNEVRRDTEYHYNELINNERKFAQLREQIIAGNVSNVQGILDGFLLDFENSNADTVREIESSWQELLNLMDSVRQAQSSLGTVSSGGYYDSTSSNTSTDPNLGAEGTRGRIRTGVFADESTAHDLANIMKSQYKATSTQVIRDGNSYRTIGNFLTEDRARAVLDKLKERNLLRVGYIEKYHKGGIVGGKGSKWAEMIHALANGGKLNPYEQLVKSKPGEVQIPPQNQMGFIKNIQSLMTPKPMVASSGGGVNVNINIDNFSGTQKQLDTLESRLVGTLKRFGKI